MKNTLRSLFGGLAAVVLAVVAQAADLAPGPVSAGKVKGDASYMLAGTTQEIKLTAGTAIPQGAVIKTGPGSIVVVVFGSGSTASIRPNSEVEITKFEQELFAGPLPANGEPSVSNTQIKIMDGEVVSDVAKLKKGSEFVVTTPVGAAGVRGTKFSVRFNASTGRFVVRVAEGGVLFRGNVDGTVRDIRGGSGFDGTDVAPLTAAEIRGIIAIIEEFVAIGVRRGNVIIERDEIDTSVSAGG